MVSGNASETGYVHCSDLAIVARCNANFPECGFKVFICPLTTKGSWDDVPKICSVIEFVRAKCSKVDIEPGHCPVCVCVRRFRDWSRCSALLVWKDSVHAMYAIWRMWNLKSFVPGSVHPSKSVFIKIGLVPLTHT